VTITAYIPCHNNEKTVGETAAALRNQTRPADQYLFINDRCTDRSPEIAKENGFQVLDLTGAMGLGAGRNLALQTCTSEILLGLDADVLPADDYIEKMHDAFQRNPDKPAIGGRLDEKYTDTLPDLWRSIHMPQHHGDAEQIDPRLLYGATMACRVDPVRRIGGWDPRCIASFDDLNLCNRLRQVGFHLLYTPTCRAWHIRRDTLDSVLRSFHNWQSFEFEPPPPDLIPWLHDRISKIWRAYRFMRVREIDHPTLSAITLLMPWSCMIRDVFALRKSARFFADPAPLIPLAGEVFTRYGAPQKLVAAIQTWLSKLIQSLEQNPAWPPLNSAITDIARHYAFESIPDAAYWRNCESGPHLFD
jgi:cellulose synthase/poly-beta-1,6-N-acetylglucosamine synthase-like glycosyltransferase